MSMKMRGEKNPIHFKKNSISEIENLKSKGLNLGLRLITVTYRMAILETHFSCRFNMNSIVSVDNYNYLPVSN